MALNAFVLIAVKILTAPVASVAARCQPVPAGHGETLLLAPVSAQAVLPITEAPAYAAIVTKSSTAAHAFVRVAFPLAAPVRQEIPQIVSAFALAVLPITVPRVSARIRVRSS